MLAPAPPETDLFVPRPEAGEHWDPHTIHTHYYAFCVPEAEIGLYSYIRYQPEFPLSQAGVMIYRGLGNRSLADSLFLDYQITLPWPEIEGNAFTTANGLTYDVVEPGRRARMLFESVDGSASFDVEAEAVTELVARGHVMPGEEQHTGATSGGTEQFMRYTGRLVVDGEEFEVDCHYPRDRSWRQLRAEDRTSPPGAPMSWTPVYFDESLAFNQIGFEHPDSDPAWAGEFEIPSGMQRAMARQAEAERERRAKVINAEGEFQASERLKDAALVIEQHPIALQLRYLQTLLELGSSQSTTIVFPAPIDILTSFLGKSSPGS